MNDSDRVHWLANRALLWLSAVERLSRPRDPRTLTAWDAWETLLFGAHACALALDHLDRHADYIIQLQTQLTIEERKLLDAFRDAIRNCRVVELRDTLEHEEDRVSGINMSRYQDKIHKGRDPGPPSPSWHSYNRRLYKLTVLDTDFDIEKAIDTALRLEPLLHRLASGTGGAAP